MAKKGSIDLNNQKISFEINNEIYNVQRFYRDKMSIDIIIYQKDGKKIGMQNIPFAHLPKKIKKIIKPN